MLTGVNVHILFYCLGATSHEIDISGWNKIKLYHILYLTVFVWVGRYIEITLFVCLSVCPYVS